MILPVSGISLSQLGRVSDHKQILGIPRLGSFRDMERASHDCLSITLHNLVVDEIDEGRNHLVLLVRWCARWYAEPWLPGNEN